MLSTTTKGFTLIELVITVAIISLLANIALPSFDEQIKRNEISAALNQLRGSLQLARSSSISLSKKVTVCATDDGKRCASNWSAGYMSFVDHNQDRQLNPEDNVIQYVKISNPEIKLVWKAFGVRNSLQWHQSGITNHQNGSFELCLQNNSKYARGLYITKAGRIRGSKDENGDGIHESARGENLSC